MRIGLIGLSALILVSAGEAQAAPPQSADRVLQSLTRCRGVMTTPERLACFEKATDALEQAVGAKEVTILDTQDIRKAKRSLFGFTLPRIGLFSDRDDGKGHGQEFSELNSTIASVRLAQNGRVELRLSEDDALWITTDPMPFPPKPGVKIRIRKGALGNYFINIDGLRSVRGMRLR